MLWIEIQDFATKTKEENSGSVEFQVFHFTNKIRRLTSHLQLHKRDFLSQRGLRRILGKRQRLLTSLSKKKKVRYKKFIDQLDIREPKTREFHWNFFFEFLIIILVLFSLFFY